MSEDASITGLNLTPNETKFLSAVMANLTSEIQFDTDAVATMLGLKDGTTARARWNTIKRTKLGIGSEKTGVSVKKATPKKGKKGTEPEGDGDDAEGGETPVKTPKKTGRKAKEKSRADGDGEEGGETPSKTPKKRGKKTKAEKAAEEETAANVEDEIAMVKEEVEDGEETNGVAVGTEKE